MANFTVTYQTNVLIPDPKQKGELKQLNFFTDQEGTDKDDAEWAVGQKLSMFDFIKDKGGYLRRSSTVVSFIVKENKTEFKNFETIGDKLL